MVLEGLQGVQGRQYLSLLIGRYSWTKSHQKSFALQFCRLLSDGSNFLSSEHLCLISFFLSSQEGLSNWCRLITCFHDSFHTLKTDLLHVSVERGPRTLAHWLFDLIKTVYKICESYCDSCSHARYARPASIVSFVSTALQTFQSGLCVPWDMYRLLHTKDALKEVSTYHENVLRIGYMSVHLFRDNVMKAASVHTISFLVIQCWTLILSSLL